MKIISFNVNGIRAILNKNFENDFKELNADIFSINETKLNDDIHKEFPLSLKDMKFILQILLLKKVIVE